LENEAYFSPCTEIGTNYYLQCIRRRAYWWLSVLPKSSIDVKLARMMSLCRELQDDSTAYHACITGIGHQAAFQANGNQATAQGFCERASTLPEERQVCISAAERALTVLAPEN
jgi:hypothetical protein